MNLEMILAINFYPAAIPAFFSGPFVNHKSHPNVSLYVYGRRDQSLLPADAWHWAAGTWFFPALRAG